MTKSILLVGVGGQGTITAAKLLTTGLLEAGCDVKMSEIHGMSQRGGTVSSHVRYNADGKVYSPVIGEEGADILVSFEQMEALRWIDYVKPEGAIVTSTDKIDCQSVLTGRTAYPENIVDELKKVCDKVLTVDTATEASEAMIRLYRNAKFKQNLVIQGIKDVHSKFDAQRVAKEHEKLFEELVR